MRRRLRALVHDPALRRYGVLLSLAHVVTWASWAGVRDLVTLLGDGQPAFCWPMFPDCWRWRVLSDDGIRAVSRAYLGLALLSAALWTRRRTAGVGVAVLAVVSVLGVAIVLQDYRLRLNQHLMMTWTLTTFLVAPHPRWATMLLLSGFYVWAGLLKLNVDWISGAALGPIQPFPRWMVVPGQVWVIVLETVGIFGLFARRAWVFWGTVAQLVVFHAASYLWVGFYYPVLMGLLLSVFLLHRLWPDAPEADGPTRAAWAPVVLFSVLQLLPRAMPGDPALTGEGRVFALHMFDAYVECDATLSVGPASMPVPNQGWPMRMRCDPVMHLGLARHLCRKGARQVGLTLASRRSTRDTLCPVLDVDDVCTADLSYSLIRHNDWLGGDCAPADR